LFERRNIRALDYPLTHLVGTAAERVIVALIDQVKDHPPVVGYQIDNETKHYEHPAWFRYAAITRNVYGKGEVEYVGFMPTDVLAEKIVGEAAADPARSRSWQRAIHRARRGARNTPRRSMRGAQWPDTPQNAVRAT
jgi:beta-galactosidase GanA